jgi:signal transduction histidine kinase/Tfp pilus assembly protein PilF
MNKKILWLLILISLGVNLSIKAQKASPVDSLEQILKTNISSKVRLQLYNDLAKLYNQNHPSPEGITCVRKAIKLARQLKDPVSEALAYNHWGDLYSKVNNQDWEGALPYYQKALKMREALVKSTPQSLERKLDLAITFSDIAYNYWQWGKLSKALENHQKSIEIAQLITDEQKDYPEIQLFLGLRYNNVGAIYWAQSRYKEAIEYYLKALHIFEKIDHPARMDITLSNIGMVYTKLQQYDKASFYLLKALHLAERVQHQAGVAYAQNNLGQLLEEQQKYDSAIVYFQESANNYLKIQEINGVGLNLNSLGTVHKKMGNYDEALKSYQQALKIANQNQSKYWQSLTMQNLGSVYLKREQWSLVEEYVKKSQKTAQEEGYREIIKENYHILSEFYADTGEPAKALEQYKLFVVAKDSIFSEEKFRQLNQIQAEYETEKKQKENEILTREKILQEKTLQRSQYEKIALIVVAFLILLFAVYVWFSRQKLKITHEQLWQRNDMINQQKEKLTQQAQQLEEVNQIKDRMFSIVAHDLRSPIAQLEGVMALVQDEHLSDQELKKILPGINRNISYTSDLVNNLLHWTKSQMHGLNIEKEDFDIYLIAQSKVNLFEKVAKEKNIKLYNEIPTGTLVSADPDMIDLVFRNLVSNALKFCSPEDAIYLKTIEQEKMIQLCIKDTGLGISPENLSKLFNNQNFTTRGTANEKGTGLGLSLCKDFIEKNNGEMWVESTVGVGSTFFFTLPKVNNIVE